MRCSTGLLDEVFVLHPKQEGQAMAMLASQVPVPIFLDKPGGHSHSFFYSLQLRFFQYIGESSKRTDFPITPIDNQLVQAFPLSLATTSSRESFFLFLRLLRCFSSPGSLLSDQRTPRYYHITNNRLSHSEIPIKRQTPLLLQTASPSYRNIQQHTPNLSL